jgi:hypothetical protein
MPEDAIELSTRVVAGSIQTLSALARTGVGRVPTALQDSSYTLHALFT